MRVLAIFVCSALFSVARAQTFDFNRDCAKWIVERGYSRDYIELKTGKIQPGWPQDWRGNVEKQQVQQGDVVMYFVPNKEKSTRVAYVEEVRAEAIAGQSGRVQVSETNWGKYTDEPCFVTDHFGRATTSNISMDTILRVWRPSLPLPPARAKTAP